MEYGVECGTKKEKTEANVVLEKKTIKSCEENVKNVINIFCILIPFKNNKNININEKAVSGAANLMAFTFNQNLIWLSIFSHRPSLCSRID